MAHTPVDIVAHTLAHTLAHASPARVGTVAPLSPDRSSTQEHFSGAELAGLVRSAASYALGRAALEPRTPSSVGAIVTRDDFERALFEVTPALGKNDEQIKQRFQARGVYSSAHAATRAALSHFCSPPQRTAALAAAAAAAPERRQGVCSRLSSLLLQPEGRGSGASALAAWAACGAGGESGLEFVRFVTASELIIEGGASEEGRCSALASSFAEARAMRRALLVLDDIDLLVADSPALLAFLRAQLRLPLPLSTSVSAQGEPAELLVLATTTTTASPQLTAAFDETLSVPLIRSKEDAIEALRAASLPAEPAALEELGLEFPVGVKLLMQRMERAI